MKNMVNFKALGIPFAEDVVEDPLSCGGGSSSTQSSSSAGGGSGPAHLTLEQTGPETVQKDGTASFKIRVTNDGGAGANGVKVVSFPHGGLTFVPGEGQPGKSSFGCTFVNNLFAECVIGQLGAGQTVERTIAYTVTAGCNGEVKSDAVSMGAGGLQSGHDVDSVDVVCGGQSSSAVSSSSVQSSVQSSSSSSVQSSATNSSVSSASSVPSSGPDLSVEVEAPEGVVQGSSFVIKVKAHNGGSGVLGPVVNLHGVGALQLTGSTGASCSQFGSHVNCPLGGDNNQVVEMTFTLNQCTGPLNLHGFFEAFDPVAEKGVFALDEATVQVACP